MRLPSFCIMCRIAHADNECICQDCYAMFIPLGPSCYKCALPLPEDGICGTCISTTPVINSVITAYRFEDPLRKLLHNFKYNEGLYLANLLTKLMLNAMPESYTTECLIPVPIHRKRLQQRGYNQSVILAQRLSKALVIPYNISHCKKIIHTQTQASLDKKQRQINLKGAFSSKKLPYKHVTIIDDLITTGHTANALAIELKNNGVQNVDLWCCARA